MAHLLSPEARVYQDLEAVAAAVSEEILHLSQTSIADRGLFAMALAGGNTPRALYHVLAGEYRERMPWPQVHLFWGDERYVPPEDSYSNYRMVRETLLDRVPLPAENVHPMPTHFLDPEEAARDYEETLREYFPSSELKFDLSFWG